MAGSRKIFTLFEHDSLRLFDKGNGHTFTHKHLESLQQYHGAKACPFFSLIHKGVKFNQHVGIIQVNDLTIEVLPKVDRNGSTDHWRRVLLFMLKKCGGLDLSHTGSAHLSLRSNNILDLYFELFIRESEMLVRRGLVKNYRSDEKNLTSLKGSLQFSQNLSKNLVHQERFWCRYRLYDQNHLLNAILFKTLKLIRQVNTHPYLISRVGALLLDFPETHDIGVSERLFDRIILNRKTRSYRKAIDIARLLLLNFHPDFRSGREYVLALMFDMNLLWERFVWISLRKQLSDFRVKAQQSMPYWRFEKQGQVRIRPDIILTRDDQTFVIDTKWKVLRQPRPADPDLQQMYAYTKYFDSEHTLLLYPGEKDGYYQGHFYPEGQAGKNKGYPCSMITIGINEGERLEKWMSRIGESVEKRMTFRWREGF